MADLTSFPDVETALMDLLSGLGTTGTVTPSDLIGQLPFLRVTRNGGGDTRLIDTARVDVDAFGATRTAAYDLAEAARQLLLGYPHTTDAGLIDLVTTESGPREITWADQNIRRFSASYSISTRR